MKKVSTSTNAASTCFNWVKKDDSARSMQRPTLSLSLKSLEQSLA